MSQVCGAGPSPTQVTEFFCLRCRAPQPRNVKKSGVQAPPPFKPLPGPEKLGPAGGTCGERAICGAMFAVCFFLWWGLNEGCWALMGIFEGLGSELRNGADMVLGCLRK
jgi:hypothetical protein